MLDRRAFSTSLAASLSWPAAHAQAAPAKVLRYAFPAAETGFDPPQVSDIYSRTITSHIFESPLRYDPLARPIVLRPRTAAALPEVSDDFRHYVFRIRPGIYFADDPAFKGQRRELTAADYVYSARRVADPKLKSSNWPGLEDEKILGLAELHQKALKTKTFDHDTPIEGLRVLDRYTFEVRLAEPRPRHVYEWASSYLIAMAREVVDFYGDKIMEHPVGTGPFKLAQWRRSSEIVLERNPGYRDEAYDAQPREGDADGAAIAARLKGRRLPMIDRVEVAIIEQPQPRWLAFLSGEHDFLERLPNDFIGVAAPGGKLAPHLARRGVQMWRTPASDVTLTVFNMDNELIGGYTPPQVALRRAIVLGTDVPREIAVPRRGQAIAAQSLVPPGTLGYDPNLRTEMGSFDPARAKGLLDLYGYVDRDGDGWRERPDGSPLRLELSTQSDDSQRPLDEIWKKSMDAIGLRVDFKFRQWPENLKATRAGQFMIWRVASTSTSPDGQGALERAWGESIGKGNLARFKLPAFDEVFGRMATLPDGPQRQALFTQATKLFVAYAPYRVHVHRILTDLAYPQIVGYRRPPFWYDFWQYIDIEPAPA
jgi:ABC-type transport system substrate-binding protein